MSVDELPGRPAEAARNSPNAPIIVMAYAGSGADRLRSALSPFPGLTCTQWTGILPLCHHAVTTWQTVDGNSGGGVSPLAAASLRALSAGLMTAVLARQGGKRWCEFTSGASAAAQSFARICPQAQFLVVHRRADSVVRAIIGSSRWGPEGPEFAPYVSAHPASPVAALASYWAAHTAEQLEFEQAQPERCHRVRVEDLTANAEQALGGISDFLALDGSGMAPLFTRDDGQNGQAEKGAPATGLPIDRIPASLLARVNELHRTLGYPPVTAAGARDD
jgi:hypothetical protein